MADVVSLDRAFGKSSLTNPIADAIGAVLQLAYWLWRAGLLGGQRSEE